MGTSSSCCHQNVSADSDAPKSTILLQEPAPQSPLCTSRRHSEIVLLSRQSKHVKVHCAARGYLMRKHLRTPYLSHLVEEMLSTESFEQVQAGKYQVEEALGPFKVPESLNDSVPVLVKSSLQLGEGCVYKGEWNLHGQMHGRGVKVTACGTKYIGQFKYGQVEGVGRLVKADGSVYQGQFIQGKACGFGIYLTPDRAKYSGQFSNNLQNGKGIEEFPDGSKYEGWFVNGVKEGHGKLSYPGGSSYQGEFKRNHFHGYGVYVWPDQSRYQGHWKFGKMHGHGTFEWADGRKFEGQFKEDMREGHGTMNWPDQSQYTGEWRVNKPDGTGALMMNGSVKKGRWRAGKRILQF